MRLYVKISLLIVSIALVTGWLSYFLANRFILRELRIGLLEKGQIITQSLTKHVAPLVISSELMMTRDFLFATVENNHEIEYAIVYNEDTQRILLHTFKTGVPERLLKEQPEYNPGKLFHVSYFPSSRGQILNIGMFLFSGSSTCVHVGLNERAILKHASILRLQLIQILCLVIITCLFIGLLISRQITAPLHQLSKAMKLFGAKGDIKQLNIQSGGKEVVQLANIFQEMILERRKAIDALNKNTEELEQRVQDRTKTLSSTNAQLMIEVKERKQTEKALKNNQNFLDRIIDQSPFATWISDEKGTMIKCNSALTKLLHITDDQLIGKYNVFEDEVAIEQGLIPKIRTVFEDGKTVSLSVEWDAPELGYKDSNKVYIEGTMFPIHDDQGNLTNVVDHWIDVTNRKLAEEEKENLEARLQQAQKMEAIGTLAGGIAHDFNNILGTILGYTEMAKDDAPPGTQLEKDLSKVLIGAHRAKDLVKQILAFSRNSQVDRIPIQIQPLIKEGLKMLRSSIPTTIKITENIDPKCKVVLADPTQIHQILMNLCTNAYHAMEEIGGALSVTLKTSFIGTDDKEMLLHITTGEYVKFSVSDTGGGIEPDVIEKIFDPYFTTKKTGKGTGLGLSIIHGILSTYGGTITVESTLGEGSTFHVYFPVVNQEAMIETLEPEEILKGKERILLIDDDKLLIEMGQDMLKRLGYHVTIRRSSLEALESFQNQPDQFDLIITDQTMPGMTGSDLARRMLQIRPDIPIILCTGYSSIISEEKAKSFGIKEFALKPLAIKDIAKLIRKVLDT